MIDWLVADCCLNAETLADELMPESTDCAATGSVLNSKMVNG